MISVVIPIYNEGELIHRLHKEVSEVMNALGRPWEVVYVNDGSRDESLEILLSKQRSDSHVVVVNLSRNWGHQAALTSGLSVARGEAIVMMDGDLQDPPTVIPAMISKWNEGWQVVVAERTSRAEGGLRAILFPLFYKVLGFLSDYPIPLNAGIFGLLDRQPLDAILNLTETNRYLPGLRSWVGYRTTVVTYDRADRAEGEPKQTFWKLLKYGLDAIFSFSYKPLRLTLIMGLISAFLLAAFAVVLFFCRIMSIGLFGQPVVFGYTSTLISILFLGSAQLIGIGILGEYIGRIYDEVKRRPLFVIDKVYAALPDEQ
jgi:dolichol-phosphate mannosyltransferase